MSHKSKNTIPALRARRSPLVDCLLTKILLATIALVIAGPTNVSHDHAHGQGATTPSEDNMQGILPACSSTVSARYMSKRCTVPGCKKWRVVHSEMCRDCEKKGARVRCSLQMMHTARGFSCKCAHNLRFGDSKAVDPQRGHGKCKEHPR